MGRQDYDGGFSSDGTGAAASDSNFGGKHSTSSAFDWGGDSDGGNSMSGSDYYQSAINRVNNNVTKQETQAQREERERKQLVDKARAEVQGRMKNFTGIKIGDVEIPTFLTTALNVLSNVGRNTLLNALDKDGARAIYDGTNFAGVVTKNALGWDVYTGRKIAGYEGEYKNLIADYQSDEGDDNVVMVRDYAGGDITANRDDQGFNTVKPDLPDVPDAGIGDGEEDVKAKREYGQNTQIQTSAQGLLTQARTRRRSLMAGGLLR